MSVDVQNDVRAAIRAQAAQRFAQLGWPTPRLEEWKYTNLAALERAISSGALVRRDRGNGSELVDDVIRPHLFGERALAEIVFIDGIPLPSASNLASVAGVHAGFLTSAPADVVEKHFARYADYERHALTALSTASGGDGAFVEVSEPVEGFIHIVHAGSAGSQSHPRNLIVAHRGAQIAVVESYVGVGKYFTNAVTEIVAGAGSVVEHVKIEQESIEAFHVGTVQIHAERSAGVTSRTIAFGGALVRNEINAALTGEGASLALEGLFVEAGSQHIDNHTVIEHLKPHCQSAELFKGILDGTARGIFDGRIVVHAGAEKTVARQTNKNLLLSESAVVDSKPTLEISNDDVKCNHASTIGQLDDEAIFYLRSRGLADAEARALLVFAFASEIVDRIGIEPVREQVRRAMFRWMPERMPERRVSSREATSTPGDPRP